MLYNISNSFPRSAAELIFIDHQVPLGVRVSCMSDSFITFAAIQPRELCHTRHIACRIELGPTDHALLQINRRSCLANFLKSHPISATTFNLPKPPPVCWPLNRSNRGQRKRSIYFPIVANITTSARGCAINLAFQNASQLSTLR